MSDTLRMMEVVDSLAQVSDLEGACRVLVSSPALGRPFHASSIGLVDDHAHLSEMARYNMPGLPQDFWHLRLWQESALSHILVNNQPTVLHRGLFDALHPDIRHDWSANPFEAVWIVPIVERGVPYGCIFLFSREPIISVDLEESHRDMLTTAVKLLLRSHEWRHGLHPVDNTDSRQRAS
jgi:hypothetical protein